MYGFPPKTHWYADININELYHNVDNLRLIAYMCIILSICTFSSTKINTLLFFKGILSHCHGKHATCTGKWTLRSDSVWCIFTHNIFFRNLLPNIIHLSHISAFQCRNTIHSVCKIMIKTVTLQKINHKKHEVAHDTYKCNIYETFYKILFGYNSYADISMPEYQRNGKSGSNASSPSRRRR